MPQRTTLATDLVAKASGLAARLSPALRSSVGDLVHSMNYYYLNLIEYHNATRDRATKQLGRTPEASRQAGPSVLFEAGLAMDRRPAKMVLVRPVGHISRLPPPRRTFCVRRCPGLWHGRRTSPGMWSGRCKHAARRVHRP